MTQAGCVQEQGSPFHAECGSGEGWLGGQSSRGHAIIYSTAGCATGNARFDCMGHSMNIKRLSIQI